MIVIWQNSTEWGGVDVLTERFSAFLTARGIEHRVVQGPGTRLWEQLPATVRCAPGEVSPIADRAEAILLPSIAMLRDRSAIAARFARANVASWVVHPTDVITALFPFAARLMGYLGLGIANYLPRLLPGHYALVRDVLGELMRIGGLIFMDGATRRQFDAVFPSLAKEPAALIPIPCPPADRSYPPPAPNAALRIGYLGRMDRMKWSALGPFIASALAPIARSRSVRLLAITEGALLANLVASCRNHGIELDRRSYMPNAQARELLCRETDLVAAMGTSALDLAACGHPVLVIDPAYRRGTKAQQRFRFIHETEDFTLGEFRDAPSYVQGLRSFGECLHMIGSDGLSRAGADYVREHHAPDIVFERLLDRLTASQSRFEALRADMERIDRSFQRLSPRYRLQSALREARGAGST